MAIQNGVVTQQMVYIHKETTNQSFLDMHYYLKATGRRNNNFFLILYDSGLAGVDPRDPNLSLQLKQRILRECVVNYWYFIREVVRIPEQGGDVSGGRRYQLNRGNLAMNFLFTLNYNMFVELPRQFGKTVGAVCRYLWVYNFGATNSEIMFVHKDHSGSKGNLKKLKEIRDALPSYLKMDTPIGIDGKKLKVPNTVEQMKNGSNNNNIVTMASARSREQADKLGRGATMPIQYYDEFAFMSFNQIAYESAVPAFSTASENAKRNRSPYGILITTTPGDLTTEQGQYAYYVRNNATEWNEMYYDYTYEQLEELRRVNTKSSLFRVSYSYQQLGKGNEYFNKMCTELQNNWAKIRREVLLEWAETASNCPFSEENLDIIKQHCREPIRTIPFGRVGQYLFKVYSDLDPTYPPIVGVDVSGATYNDSSAITVVDSKTTIVTATLNNNHLPTDDLADVIYHLINDYIPNGIVCIERNGGFGSSVIHRLLKTSIKNNLYYEIKERAVEEVFDGVQMVRTKKRVKVYGLDSTKSVRARLIELLYMRVEYHKDKFIAPILYEEMRSMVVKPSGKVEHSDTTHDDQVFSYLMAIYVWYDGQNLSQFGIQKNVLKTDEEEEIVDTNELEPGMEVIDLESTVIDDESDIKASIDYINSDKTILNKAWQEKTYQDELDMLNYQLATNRVFRKAYNEKYNMIDDKNIIQTVVLPNSIFDIDSDGEEDDMFKVDNGNLYSMWNQ